LLYCLVGGPGSALVAFHKETGREAWRALTTKEICYSPPIIEDFNGRRQLIVWLSDSVNGLHPATGSVDWTVPYPVSTLGPAVNIPTMRRLGDLLFVTSAYEGSMVLKFEPGKGAPSILWQDSEKKAMSQGALNCLMCTPLVRDGYVYGVDFGGGLRCIEAKTGKQLWQTYAPICGKFTDCGSAFLVRIDKDDRAVLFNDQGELILAELTPKSYTEISRARILEPLQSARNRHVVWTYPAFAHRCVFARNEKEMVCVSLAAGQS
jgi:hypothetical protein